MEAKPIFVVYLPIEYVENGDIVQFQEKLTSALEGWAILIVPDKNTESLYFESFSVNSLTEMEKQHLEYIMAQVTEYIPKKQLGED